MVKAEFQNLERAGNLKAERAAGLDCAPDYWQKMPKAPWVCGMNKVPVQLASLPDNLRSSVGRYPLLLLFSNQVLDLESMVVISPRYVLISAMYAGYGSFGVAPKSDRPS